MNIKAETLAAKWVEDIRLGLIDSVKEHVGSLVIGLFKDPETFKDLIGPQGVHLVSYEGFAAAMEVFRRVSWKVRQLTGMQIVVEIEGPTITAHQRLGSSVSLGESWHLSPGIWEIINGQVETVVVTVYSESKWKEQTPQPKPGPWWTLWSGIVPIAEVRGLGLLVEEEQVKGEDGEYHPVITAIVRRLPPDRYSTLKRHEFPYGTPIEVVMLKAEELLIEYLQAVNERFGSHTP